jgi:16S rRNA A1518/A1519 N6-dimethyltransferase RsmA/KsgA/DIM1 with predicted DNA glycosylase/AP lyase activity
MVIASVNTKQGIEILHEGEIIPYGTEISLAYNNDKAQQILERLVEATNYYFYVDQLGKLNFKPKPNVATHIATIGKNVSKLNLVEDYESIANKVKVKWKNGTTAYEEEVMDNLFIKESILQEESITSEASALILRNNRLDKDNDKINDTHLVISTLYNIETLQP